MEISTESQPGARCMALKGRGNVTGSPGDSEKPRIRQGDWAESKLEKAQGEPSKRVG